MTKPTRDELETYLRVRRYLEDNTAIPQYGYLEKGDTVFRAGAAEIDRKSVV